MKSLMGELTDPTNRAEAFALLTVTWSMGMSLGYVKSDFGEIIRMMRELPLI